MTALTHVAPRQIALGFAAGVAVTALMLLVGAALAQTATPTPAVILDQMLAWCRQMMGQAAGMVQGMMSGICMMGR